MPFSLCFKIRVKFHATKPLPFSLHFLFRRDQDHYSHLISRIMKMYEQILKNKPTDVGRIALERQAGGKTFDPVGVRTTDLPIPKQMHFPLDYQALLFVMLQRFYISNKLYFGVRAIEITQI